MLKIFEWKVVSITLILKVSLIVAAPSLTESILHRH